MSVWMSLGSRWAKSQSSESLSLNRRRVGSCTILVNPYLAMENSSTQNSSLQALRCPPSYQPGYFQRRPLGCWIQPTIQKTRSPILPLPYPSHLPRVTLGPHSPTEASMASEAPATVMAPLTPTAPKAPMGVVAPAAPPTPVTPMIPATPVTPAAKPQREPTTP